MWKDIVWLSCSPLCVSVLRGIGRKVHLNQRLIRKLSGSFFSAVRAVDRVGAISSNLPNLSSILMHSAQSGVISIRISLSFSLFFLCSRNRWSRKTLLAAHDTLLVSTTRLIVHVIIDYAQLNIDVTVKVIEFARNKRFFFYFTNG